MELRAEGLSAIKLGWGAAGCALLAPAMHAGQAKVRRDPN